MQVTNIEERVVSFGEGIPSIKTDPKELFKRSILDQTKDYPLPQPIVNFVHDGEIIPLLTKKSFSLWQGKQKSKKTTALALAVASFINPVEKSERTYFLGAVKGPVLFFDNEQGESYAARTMRLILKLANLETSPNLIYCDLREFSPKDRLAIIHAAIEVTEDVRWVIIDGIVDVMDDFMSAEEGHFVITDLLKLCSKYDIHVSGVLHQNKGQSKDARAHVGSIASQKCEIEVMVERSPDDNSMSIVSAKECRGLPFEDFAIRWDKGELPKIVQGFSRQVHETVKKQKALLPEEIADETHREILAKVLRVDSTPKLSEFELGLVNEISTWYGFKVAQSVAKSYRKYYLDNGFVRTEGKTPHTRYLLNQ
ncbi:AAA family ATPase [Olivibacter sp. CPCC 100613]|uniref:AAA family ATPase n=1 Tax=Olivibacter sp. CPCC 100613 TaxID=3079931 RepID=UPI002FFA5B55